MQTKKIEIVEFEDRYINDIENLVLPIQQIEFGVKITREEQPDLMDIKGVFQQGDGNFWLARVENQLVGTIGVMDIGNKQVALKKMFVAKDYRGKEHGVAAALIKNAKDWCHMRGIKQIFLGTTGQMTAAQRFYEKNGFVEITKSQLPPNFPIVHVDTKFYRCDLV